MNLQKRNYESLYDLAKEESHLSWYREDIPLFLARAVESLGGKGSALDIGCGTGSYSLFMAQRGLQVTAVDYISKALDIAKLKANKSGVSINFVQADVIEWKTAGKYDLIFDRGCLHSLKRKDRIKYKEQIMGWMSNNCDYLLIHFGKKRLFNFRIGEPVRKTPAEIERFFSPELKLKECYQETSKRSPLFHYWFNLNTAISARQNSNQT